MDFRLKVFLAVARNLSFTKASKELFISQPAITKHIQELENTYMVQLFSRQGGRIELTPQGELFKVHAQRIIEEYENLWYRMELSKERLSGDFKIGISANLTKPFISPLVEKMASEFPQMHTSFIIDTPEQIKEATENGSIDLGIVESAGTLEILLDKRDEKGETISSFIHRMFNKLSLTNQ